MRLLLFLSILLTPFIAYSQQGGSFNYINLLPSTLPTRCSPGQLRVQTGTTTLNVCGGSSNWSAVGAPPTYPTTIVQGGTDSINPLVNNKLIVSYGGTIGEIQSGSTVGYVLIGTGSTSPPQFAQNFPGNAGNITASSNSSLTTLSSLSLPTSQLSGTVGLNQIATIPAYSVLNNNYSYTNNVSAGQSVILGTPSIVDTGIAFQTTGNVNGYFQHILQNTNSGSAASADFIANNNLGTASTYYADLGINSSGFTGSGSLNLPNASYLYANSGDLVLATNTVNSIHMVTNSGSTDALIINASNKPILPAFTGYLYGNASSPITASTTIPSTAMTGVATIAQGGTNTGNTLAGNKLIVSYGGTIGEIMSGSTVGYVLTGTGSNSPPIFAPASVGFTDPMTSTGDMIYSSNNTPTAARLAIGSSGSIMAVVGGIPAWVNSAQGSYYFEGYHTQAVSWSTTSATYADLTPSGGGATLTTRIISGFTTVVTANGNLPAITFPVVAGTAYQITARFFIEGSNTSIIGGRLVDANGTVIAQMSDSALGATGLTDELGTHITGIYAPAFTGLATVKIQLAISSGTVTIGFGTLGNPIEWTLYPVNPNLTISGNTTATVSSAVISGSTNSIYLANTSSNATTLTLPNTAIGATVEMKDSTGSFQTNNLTVNPNGVNIDGTSGNAVYKGKYQDISLVSDGANWFNRSIGENLSARYTGAAPVISIGGQSAGQWVSIAFTQKDFDDNASYNTTTGVYTCPTTGKYEVSTQLSLTCATCVAASSAGVGVYYNGAIHSGSTQFFVTAAIKPINPQIVDVVNCTSGNTINVVGRIASGETTPSVVGDYTSNWLWIRKLGQ